VITREKVGLLKEQIKLSEFTKILETIDKAVKVIEVYACDKNYKVDKTLDPPYYITGIEYDKGKIAKEFLEEFNK